MLIKGLFLGDSDSDNQVALITTNSILNYTESVEPKNQKKRCSTSWKKNVRKNNKNSGLPYINTNGNHVPGRFLGEPCNHSCR